MTEYQSFGEITTQQHWVMYVGCHHHLPAVFSVNVSSAFLHIIHLTVCVPRTESLRPSCFVMMWITAAAAWTAPSSSSCSSKCQICLIPTCLLGEKIKYFCTNEESEMIVS